MSGGSSQYGYVRQLVTDTIIMLLKSSISFKDALELNGSLTVTVDNKSKVVINWENRRIGLASNPRIKQEEINTNEISEKQTSDKTVAENSPQKLPKRHRPKPADEAFDELHVLENKYGKRVARRRYVDGTSSEEPLKKKPKPVILSQREIWVGNLQYMLTAQNGKYNLYLDGYKFYANASFGGRSLWNCTKVKRHQCRARVATEDYPELGQVGALLYVTGEHNHSSDGDGFRSKPWSDDALEAELSGIIQQPTVKSMTSPETTMEEAPSLTEEQAFDDYEDLEKTLGKREARRKYSSVITLTAQETESSEPNVVVINSEELWIDKLQYKRPACGKKYNLFFDEYKFYNTTSYDGKTYWGCTKNKCYSCRARVVTKDIPQYGASQPGALLYVTGEHNHTPENVRIHPTKTVADNAETEGGDALTLPAETLNEKVVYIETTVESEEVVPQPNDECEKEELSQSEKEICIGPLRYKRTAKCDQYNLFYKDFKYYKVKASHGRTQWLCTKNTSFRCRARVVTSDLPQNGVGQPGKLLYFTGQHTHDPAEGSIRSRATQQEAPPERTPKWILNAAETPPEEDDDDDDDEDVRINDDGSFWIGDLFYRRSRTGNGYTLVYEGHKYCRGSQAGKHTYWQCTRRTAPETLGCKGRLTTRNIARFGFRAPGRLVRTSNPHNHPPIMEGTEELLPEYNLLRPKPRRLPAQPKTSVIVTSQALQVIKRPKAASGDITTVSSPIMAQTNQTYSLDSSIPAIPICSDETTEKFIVKLPCQQQSNDNFGGYIQMIDHPQ